MKIIFHIFFFFREILFSPNLKAPLWQVRSFAWWMHSTYGGCFQQRCLSLASLWGIDCRNGFRLAPFSAIFPFQRWEVAFHIVTGSAPRPLTGWQSWTRTHSEVLLPLQTGGNHLWTIENCLIFLAKNAHCTHTEIILFFLDKSELIRISILVLTERFAFTVPDPWSWVETCSGFRRCSLT